MGIEVLKAYLNASSLSAKDLANWDGITDNKHSSDPAYFIFLLA